MERTFIRNTFAIVVTLIPAVGFAQVRIAQPVPIAPPPVPKAAAPTLAPTAAPAPAVPLAPVMGKAPLQAMPVGLPGTAPGTRLPALPAVTTTPITPIAEGAIRPQGVDSRAAITRPDVEPRQQVGDLPGGHSLQETRAAHRGMPEGNGLTGAEGKLTGEGVPFSAKEKMGGLVGETVVEGMRHGDTFAGNIVNSRQRGDANDFRGSGAGNAASDPSGTPNTDSAPSPGAGGTTVPMTNGDSAGVASGLASGGVMDPARTVGSDFRALVSSSPESRITAVPAAGGKAPPTYAPIHIPKLREREDALPGGAAPPMGRQDVVNAGRAVGAQAGAAGGAGDGRGSSDPGGSSTTMMRAQGTAGAPEKEDRSGATLNLNQVLEINQVVNPGAR